MIHVSILDKEDNEIHSFHSESVPSYIEGQTLFLEVENRAKDVYETKDIELTEYIITKVCHHVRTSITDSSIVSHHNYLNIEIYVKQI